MHFFSIIKWYRIKWYRFWSRSKSPKVCQHDPLLALYGSGKELWSEEHADEYVCPIACGLEIGILSLATNLRTLAR
jgi:hypothetical protein